MEMEEILKAERQLKQQLKEAGLDLGATYLNMVWHAFRMFISAPPEGDASGFMIEKSTFNMDGRKLNRIRFVRHIAMSDATGDMVCTERLHMQLRDRPVGRDSTRTFYPADVNGFRTVVKLGVWDAEFSRIFS